MKALLIICSIILFIGLAQLPIGYYRFLRIVISIGAVIVIYFEFKGEINGWIITFGLIAILFNPIFPVYLGKIENWIIPDVISAFIFLIKAFSLPLSRYNNKG